MTKKPIITVIINFYNNEREAPRSLYTLSAAYQQNVTESDYQVIAIDNGSTKPIGKEKVESYGSNFSYHYHKSKHPSPCEAMNYGVEIADAPYVMLMIDGAHLLSPRVLDFTIKAIKAYTNPVILTLPLHLGPYMQFYSKMDGYNQEEEDKLLNTIPWKKNGYSLFNISNLKNYERNFFSQLYESNCFTLHKSEFLRHGGFNEKFKSSGGGLVNLDVFKKLSEDPKLENVTLVGEASFHQYHGGVTTNKMKKHQPLPEYKKEYKEIYDIHFTGATYDSEYIGATTAEVQLIIPKQRWHIYRDISTAFMLKGDIETSIKILNLAKDQHPNRLKVHMQLANVYEKLNDPENAVKCYLKAIEISPSNEIDQYVKLGVLYLNMGKEEKGQNMLQKATILEPDNAKINAKLAEYYIKTNQKAKAIEQINLALEMIKKRRADPNIYISLSQSCRKLGKYQKGIQSLNELHKFNPANVNAYFFKAILFNHLNKYNRAIFCLERSLELNFSNPIKIRMKLAEIYEKINKPEAALNQYLRIGENNQNQTFLATQVQKLSTIIKQKKNNNKA